MPSRFFLLTFDASHLPRVQEDPFLHLTALVEVSDVAEGRSRRVAFDAAERTIRQRYHLSGPGYEIRCTRTEDIAAVHGVEGQPPVATFEGCKVWQINEFAAG
jgi:hypothetical protein